MSLESKLEQWWQTEPFGFDHPDTKADILRLMKWAATESEVVKELESALEQIGGCEKLDVNPYSTARVALASLRKARDEYE